ncbi:MAG: TlpA family protein disulfide reductase [Planctomycetes bacterium]|nr:TlpA family protein disulfide reductase [Planctomycetota bacterium]
MNKQIKTLWRSGGMFLAAVILLTGLFILINYQRGSAQASGLNPVIGRGRPIVLHGQVLGGGHLSTAQWKGKVVVVDFWGTWCPWCVKEAPYIAKLYSRYHRHGLEVVGVALDDTATAVHHYRQEHPKENWPQIFDQHPGNGAIAQKLGISGLPTEFIIDRGGILRYIVVGYAPNRIAADVRKLLAKGTASQ